MRNPVTNIVAMSSATDIPDWTFVEALGLGAFDFARGHQPLTAEVLGSMLAKSPIVHAPKVVTPTLIAVGAQDRRVPMAQGIEYYHALRAQGVKTRLLCYEKEGHALEGAACDMDFWVNIAAWFRSHLPDPAPGPADLYRATSLGV